MNHDKRIYLLTIWRRVIALSSASMSESCSLIQGNGCRVVRGDFQKGLIRTPDGRFGQEVFDQT